MKIDASLLTPPKYEKFVPDPNKVSILNIVGRDPCPEDRIINDRHKLKWLMGVLREEGKTIGYTSGVYDMVHEGHVIYLIEAKKYCDILILGIDEDDLVKVRKRDNPNRPYDKLSTRLTVLVTNRSVDILAVRYAGERLEQLVIDLLPDVAIFSRSTKDTENFEEDINRALKDYCGKIVFLDPQSANSTTSKMGKIMEDGANEYNEFLRTYLKRKISGTMLDKSFKKFLDKKKGGAQ